MTIISLILSTIKTKKLAQYFILLLIICLGYYPITFLTNGIGHDFLNCWMPWRYYISSSIEQGFFPWWNPFQQMGYPIHADLQGPLWYPENLLSSFLGIQSVSYLLIVHLFHIWMGAIAILELSKFFKASIKASLLVAIIYAFSGFYLAHSMHQFSIYSATWIPFLLLFWLQMLETGKIKYAIYGAFIMFLNLTGGNHTFTVISVYLFALLWLGYFIYSYKDKSKLKAIVVNTLVYIVLCTLVATLTIVLYGQVSPYLDRINGLIYSQASLHPYTINSILSFINPAAPINSIEFFKTDPTMSNAYFTIFGVTIFIVSFFRKKYWLETFFLWFGLACLVISFGDNTLVYKVCYNYLPLLNRFRFPSYYTYFLILLAMPVIAKTLTEIKSFNAKLFKSILCLIGLLFLGQITYSIFNFDNVKAFFGKETNSLFQFANNTNLETNLFIFGIVGIVITVLYLIFIQKTKVYYLVFLEIIIFVPFILHHTTVVDYNPIEMQQCIDEHAKPFNSTALDPINKHGRDLDQLPCIWATKNVYLKNIDKGGYNSFKFSKLNVLEDSLADYSDELFKNPVVYLSNKLINENQLTEFDSSKILLSESIFKELSTRIDANQDFKSKVELTEINPEGFEIKVFTEGEQLLSLLQTNYIGWNVNIDNKPAKLLETNYMFMGVVVPKGAHVIQFYYKNNVVKIAALISYSIWFLLFIAIVIIKLKEKRSLLPHNSSNTW